jgi:hypothetical protein
MDKTHYHNGTDSPKLVFQDAIENGQQPAVSPVANTAGATYTATEQGMINATKNSLNDLITKLQNIGILK